MVMNNELEMICKKAVVACFMLLSQHFALRKSRWVGGNLKSGLP